MSVSGADLTPEQFELAVKKEIARSGANLENFEVTRRESISTADGTYEIDVTARFEALGVSFLTLIECKRHSNPIKREVVQILNDRIRAVGAQKGILFSTNSFQSGAVTYAKQHGIALVVFIGGSLTRVTKTYGGRSIRPGSYTPFIAQLESTKKVTYPALAGRGKESLLLKTLGVFDG